MKEKISCKKINNTIKTLHTVVEKITGKNHLIMFS